MILKLTRNCLEFRPHMPHILLLYNRDKKKYFEYPLTKEVDGYFPRGAFSIYVDGEVSKSGTLAVYRRVGDQTF